MKSWRDAAAERLDDMCELRPGEGQISREPSPFWRHNAERSAAHAPVSSDQLKEMFDAARLTSEELQRRLSPHYRVAADARETEQAFIDRIADAVVAKMKAAK